MHKQNYKVATNVELFHRVYVRRSYIRMPSRTYEMRTPRPATSNAVGVRRLATMAMPAYTKTFVKTKGGCNERRTRHESGTSLTIGIVVQHFFALLLLWQLVKVGYLLRLTEVHTGPITAARDSPV